MKFFTLSVVIHIFLMYPSSASPLAGRLAKNLTTAHVNLGNRNGVPVGAAYFLTNEPDGNFIVGADIGSDGKLTLRRATHTGGLGLHANPDGSPDPLVSQACIKAFAAANLLAAVNAGSNTLSLFSIDPTDPTNLRMVGRPVSSAGEFPVSVAFNKDGSRVCALNGGAINGVNCYKVDKNRGLISLANTNRSLNLNQTTPPTAPENTVSQVIFSEDGSKLIVGVKGIRPNPGFLVIWGVQQDGSLSANFTKVTSTRGGLRAPFGMTLVPGKDAVLIGDPGVGFDLIGRDGKIDSAVTIDSRAAPGWTSFSAKTGNFYITDVGTSVVTEVNVNDKLNGTIVKQYQQTKGSATIDNDIASIGKNDFMYILAGNTTTVNVLSLRAPGQAQALQTLDISGPAKNANLKISAANIQGMTTFVTQQNDPSLLSEIMTMLKSCSLLASQKPKTS